MPFANTQKNDPWQPIALSEVSDVTIAFMVP